MKIILRVIKEFAITFEQLLAFFPGTIGRFFRRTYYKKLFGEMGNKYSSGIGVEILDAKNISLGNNVSLGNYSVLHANNGGKMAIGNNVGINRNSYIGCSESGQIIMGNNILIAQNVVIRASNHVYSDVSKPIRNQGHIGGKIIISDDVWIGANVVILPDVTIGTHSVIAAGSVVTKDIEPYTVAAGVPAKTIKKLDIELE